MTIIVTEKIIEMFIILLCGVIAYKTGLIDKASASKMSNLLLMLISPLLSFLSYQTDFSKQLFFGLVMTFVASVVTYIIVIALSELIFRGSKEHLSIEKLSAVYSNCGFIGIPLINGILGSEGVLYLTAYLTAFNILLWTHGILVMGDKFNLKTLWKKLLTPAILAVIGGIICFTAQIRLPELLTSPLGLIANMNTPLAMLVAGANLAQADILNSLKKGRIYWFSFVKLILCPVLCLIPLYFMHLDFNIAFTVFIATSCPTGASAIMFAERYHKDAGYATELFVVTTILSVLTIPLVSIPATWLL